MEKSERLNILEYIDWCMDEMKMSEEDANRMADLEYNLEGDNDHE